MDTVEKRFESYFREAYNLLYAAVENPDSLSLLERIRLTGEAMPVLLEAGHNVNRDEELVDLMKQVGHKPN